jgi:hypothetical protein
MPLRLAVDFDGVCHDPKNVKPGYKLGQPIAGAKEALTKLREDGAIIVIHSVWADTHQQCEAISKWCRYFDIPYDFVTNIKPDCDIYIDNKGYRFENWSDTLDYVRKLHLGT